MAPPLVHQLSGEQNRALTLLLRHLPKTAGVFLVGGTIRDVLLCRLTKDLDLVVTAMPLRRLERALRPLGTVRKVGARFGVLLLRPKRTGLTIDIALPRTEHAFGTGGYRDFSFASDPHLPIEHDLARRDFTINAMAYDLRNRTLIDPHHGQEDLRKKLLRTVGNPNTRFHEDYSRLLRLLRFHIQLNFFVERRTESAARMLMQHLNDRRAAQYVVPREVIAEQFLRTLAVHPQKAFDAADRLGVLDALLPELMHLRHCTQSKDFHSEGTALQHTRAALGKLSSAAWDKQFGKNIPLVVVIATLLHDIGKPFCKRLVRRHGKPHISFLHHDERGAALATTICKRLKLASYQGLVKERDVSWLIRNHLLAIRNARTPLQPLALARTFSGERGMHLLQLMYADLVASKRPKGTPALQPYHRLRHALHTMLLWKRDHYETPRPLLGGNALIRLSVRPGPKFGHLLDRVYTAQLTKAVRTKTQALALARRLVRDG